MWIPVEHSWRLNERHYGALQGLNKAQTAAKYGDDQVLVWRRSYDEPPPALCHSFLALSREPVLDRLLRRRVVQLLLVARVRLVAVISFGVTLRSFLVSLAHRCSSL